MHLFLYIGCDATISLPDSAGIFLEDANNFSFTSEVQAQSIPIVPKEDAIVHWGDLSIDMLGNNMNSTDINMLYCFLGYPNKRFSLGSVMKPFVSLIYRAMLNIIQPKMKHPLL